MSQRGITHLLIYTKEPKAKRAKGVLPDLPPSIHKLINEAMAIEAEQAQEAGALGFMCRSMVQASLPSKKVEGAEFIRRNGKFTLSLLAPSRIGLPYGTIPRLLLVWLATEAVRTQERELLLGDSLSGFMRELGLTATGGRWGSIPRLKEQTKRLFACSITGIYEDGDQTALLSQKIADQAHLWWDTKSPDQAGLWQSSVRLSEQFFNEVTEHPVPIDLRAIQALKRSPLALDISAWLTYRSAYATRSSVIPWEALAAQFGSDYGRLRAFKEAFLGELRKVQVVYPEARVDLATGGLLVHPAPTHIKPIGRR